MLVEGWSLRYGASGRCRGRNKIRPPDRRGSGASKVDLEGYQSDRRGFSPRSFRLARASTIGRRSGLNFRRPVA
jgi:hypothetical protein